MNYVQDGGANHGMVNNENNNREKWFEKIDSGSICKRFLLISYFNKIKTRDLGSFEVVLDFI